MATYYMIHCYDQNSKDGFDLIKNYKLYTTFEKAASAADKYIQERIDDYDEESEVFEKPAVTSMDENRKFYHYYETMSGHLFTITRVIVAE